MVLNIFPRGKKPEVASAKETVATLPEPSPEAMESLDNGAENGDEPKKRPTRRGSRGGRGRTRAAGADALDDGIEEIPDVVL
ncbi:MAG: hypothetical protein ABI939_04960, partial [Anaerolineaceae bacterium]